MIPNKLSEYLAKSDDLPYGLTAEKIVDRGYDFYEVNDYKIEFKIERHPGLFGRSSRGPGIGISARWHVKTKYTLDLRARAHRFCNMRLSEKKDCEGPRDKQD